MADTALQYVLAFWLSHGATPAQASALTHLAWQETRGQHCVVSSHGDHYLYQWRAERYRKLVRFAGTRSCPDLETQLRFADQELHQKPYQGFWSVSAGETRSFLRRCYALGRCY